MDEYSPKQYDIAQLKFICESIYHDGVAILGDNKQGWVNDPTAAANLQLNELIEHVASFIMIFKIKFHEENSFTELVEEYLDDTYTLFSNYGINDSDLRRWQKTKARLFKLFSGESLRTLMNT